MHYFLLKSTTTLVNIAKTFLTEVLNNTQSMQCILTRFRINSFFLTASKLLKSAEQLHLYLFCILKCNELRKNVMAQKKKNFPVGKDCFLINNIYCNHTTCISI